MQFGMPTLIENNSLEKNIELCRDLGFDFIELNMNMPLYQTEKLENTAYLKKSAAESGIYFTIHIDENFNAADFNRSVSSAYIETMKRVINSALEIGTPVLNMHMHHGVYFTLPGRRLDLFGEYFDVYAESQLRFKEICEKEIGGADIKICIENTDGFKDFEKKAIEIMLESPIFGLTFDIGHSHGVNDCDEEFFTKHENRLWHFHMHDAIGKDHHLALGTGEIDLEKRFRAAAKNNSRCVIETKTRESLIKSAEWLDKNCYR